VRLALHEIAIEKSQKVEQLIINVTESPAPPTSSDNSAVISSSAAAYANAWELSFEENLFPEFYQQLKAAIVKRREDLKLDPILLPDGPFPFTFSILSSHFSLSLMATPVFLLMW